jgi:hypothetical protein
MDARLELSEAFDSEEPRVVKRGKRVDRGIKIA